MKNTLDLNKMGLEPMNEFEMIQMLGGGTDFAYDCGTAIRFVCQNAVHNYRGAVCTLANWFCQNS